MCANGPLCLTVFTTALVRKKYFKNASWLNSQDAFLSTYVRFLKQMLNKTYIKIPKTHTHTHTHTCADNFLDLLRLGYLLVTIRNETKRSFKLRRYHTGSQRYNHLP